MTETALIQTVLDGCLIDAGAKGTWTVHVKQIRGTPENSWREVDLDLVRGLDRILLTLKVTLETINEVESRVQPRALIEDVIRVGIEHADPKSGVRMHVLVPLKKTC